MNPSPPVRCAIHDLPLVMVENTDGRPLWVCPDCSDGDGLLYDLGRRVSKTIDTLRREGVPASEVAALTPTPTGDVCAEWFSWEPREPQQVCPCGHYAAVHWLETCARCEGIDAADSAPSR